jgi:hypothetical protein
LLVVTHFNRSRDARGPQRITGAGPTEWGRFLIAADDPKRHERNGGTETVRRVTVQGTSLPDQSFVVSRFVGAEDPADPASPLTYDVEVTEQGDERPGMSLGLQRVLDALGGEDQPKTVQEIGDLLAADGRGKPYKATTIRDKLAELLADGLVDSLGESGTEKQWWRIEG